MFNAIAGLKNERSSRDEMSSLIIPKEEPDYLYEEDLGNNSQLHPSTIENPLNFSNTSADKAIQRSQ